MAIVWSTNPIPLVIFKKSSFITMPCCITLLHYGCGHKLLWKTHCSHGCSIDELCPKEKQEILASIVYNWQCEECHTRTFQDEDAARTDMLISQENLIISSGKSEAQINEELLALRSRENWLDNRFEYRRVEQVEEIQWAADFAEEYGKAVWKIKYGQRKAARAGEGRKEYLLSLKKWDVTVRFDLNRDPPMLETPRGAENGLPAAGASPDLSLETLSMDPNKIREVLQRPFLVNTKVPFAPAGCIASEA